MNKIKIVITVDKIPEGTEINVDVSGATKFEAVGLLEYAKLDLLTAISEKAETTRKEGKVD